MMKPQSLDTMIRELPPEAQRLVRELSEQGVKVEARRIEDPNRVPTPWN